jgi:hypothetical protein
MPAKTLYTFRDTTGDAGVATSKNRPTALNRHRVESQAIAETAIFGGMVPRGGIEPPTLRFSVTISMFSLFCSTWLHLKILGYSTNSFARVFLHSLSRLHLGCNSVVLTWVRSYQLEQRRRSLNGL